MVLDWFRHWNTTEAERAASYPCDAYLAPPFERYNRGIDVAAPAETVFRRLCQLKVAPYSYDWLDNRGNRSPRELTPGADQLAVGQPFLVFQIVEFEPGRHLSGRSRPEAERIYGQLAVTYRVTPRGDAASRLAVRLNASTASLRSRILGPGLVAGDAVMMRAQLINLKRLAEHDAAGG